MYSQSYSGQFEVFLKIQNRQQVSGEHMCERPAGHGRVLHPLTRCDSSIITFKDNRNGGVVQCNSTE